MSRLLQQRGSIYFTIYKIKYLYTVNNNNTSYEEEKRQKKYIYILFKDGIVYLGVGRHFSQNHFPFGSSSSLTHAK